MVMASPNGAMMMFPLIHDPSLPRVSTPMFGDERQHSRQLKGMPTVYGVRKA
ncbi:unnamed protein product [Periconia digitata]|uniref:Uncharacterized protein n=1 Tax=Periconia digitata TaxID=1303443 RepID=A0A9W4ULH0_9PLEO|nr:unnamed protein product [Periconia digitata]